MRKARLALYFIVLAATAVWPQQSPAPKPDEAAPAPIVRAPHSTKEDLAVPLCPTTFNDSLETDGIAGKDDKTITQPKPTYQPDPEFSDEARRQVRCKDGIHYFEVYLSCVVDTTGKPQDVCLMQSAGWGLDAGAANAVRHYQFKPATRDGKPVAARFAVRKEFRIY
jgi:TonB family protein